MHAVNNPTLRMPFYLIHAEIIVNAGSLSSGSHEPHTSESPPCKFRVVDHAQTTTKQLENSPSLTMPWQNKWRGLQDFLICFFFYVINHATNQYSIRINNNPDHLLHTRRNLYVRVVTCTCVSHNITSAQSVMVIRLTPRCC